MTALHRPITVAILTVPESTASVTYGMYDMFMSAGRDWGLIVNGTPGTCLIHPVIVAAQSESFTAANGVRIEPQATLDSGCSFDLVCVPELLISPQDPLNGRFSREVAWLRRCHGGGATLATACSGALMLAEAGLLDGHEATTHWAYCDVLQSRYPAVKIRRQQALVISGEGQRLVMAGGGTTWLDLVLYLIARFTGVDAAMQVARLNLIDWHTGGQQPFARLARSRQVGDGVIAECQTWIAQNYQEPAPVAAMVKISGLPERSFIRRFQQATGMSPLEYVHTLRLEEAKQMLEAGTQPIAEIAGEVGYEDAGFFSRLFRRKVDLTPAQYRKRFGSVRRTLSASVAQSGAA